MIFRNKNFLCGWILLSTFCYNITQAQSNDEEFLYDFVKNDAKVKSCVIEVYSLGNKAGETELQLEKKQNPLFDRNGVKSSYSKEGKKIKESKADEKGKLLWSTDYIYLPSGKISQIIEKDNKQKMRWKSSFKYDANGNRTEYKELMGDSSVYVYTTYKYDSANLKIEKEEHIFDSIKSKIKITYFYDTSKNNIKKVIYKSDKFSQEIHSLYQKKLRTDKQKTLIADTFYNSSNTPYKVIVYEFENGKVISENVFNMQGEEKEKEAIRNEYELDDNENWVEFKRFKGDILVRKILRKIEYFPESTDDDTK